MHLTAAQFSAHLTGALDGASLRRVERHLERCESCRSHVAMLGLQDQALAGLLVDDPPEGFFDELLVEAARHIDAALAARVAARMAPPASEPRPIDAGVGEGADAEERAAAHADALTRALVAELDAGAPPSAPPPPVPVVVAPPPPAPAVDPAPLAAAVAAVPPSAPVVVPVPPRARGRAAPPPRRASMVATMALIALVVGCVAGGWWVSRGIGRDGRAGGDLALGEARSALAPQHPPSRPSLPSATVASPAVPTPHAPAASRDRARPSAARSTPDIPVAPAPDAPMPRRAEPAPPVEPATPSRTLAPATADLAPAPTPVAEMPRGLLCGTVFDEAGRPVVAALVLLADIDLSIRTDRNGRFCLSVPAGERTLTVLGMGFRTSHQLVVVGRDTPELALTLRSASPPVPDGAPR